MRSTSNTTGNNNTATGVDALYSNTTGNDNTATVLVRSLATPPATTTRPTVLVRSISNTTGNNNTATGFHALFDNTTGDDNTAIGIVALANNTTGSNNIALGAAPAAISPPAITISTSATEVLLASPTPSASADEEPDRHLYRRHSGVTAANGGIAVVDRPNGQLGTVTSSARFKEEIKPMDKASEAILALKPVTFRYKNELDPEASRSLASWPRKWKR